MLADECPNSQCFGIPLVRPPKVGGDQDPRKKCVICLNIYIDREDGVGLIRMSPATESSGQVNAVSRESTLPVRSGVFDVEKGKGVHRDLSSLLEPDVPPNVDVSPSGPKLAEVHSVAAQLSDSAVVIASLQTLHASLEKLTDRLNLLNHSQVLDAALISQTADGMGKVAQALILLKQL